MTFEIDDIISTDSYIGIIENYPDLISHIKTDFFLNGYFLWRNKKHPTNIKENVIISHSDYPVINEYIKNFKTVFCVNNNTSCNNVYSLPLGIPNDCEDLNHLKIIGNKLTLLNIMNEELEKTHLCYLNFSTTTDKSLRKKIFEHFNNFNWVYNGNYEISEKGRLNYLKEIKQSKFVLCPRGNGIDTHRLWETLYLGSIPIVEYHKTHDFCEDLPVLFIDNWFSLNQNYLEEKYNEFLKKTFNFDKLKISYWNKFIKNKIF